MSIYQQEVERLTAAENLVEKLYPRFGVNKRRETVRLLWEISRREKTSPEAVLPPDPPVRFADLKAYLLGNRFPLSSAEGVPLRTHLPRLELKAEEVVTDPPFPLSPKKIYIEAAAASSALAIACREKFPDAEREEIPSRKEFLAGWPSRGIADYNRRGETLFIIAEEWDFFKPCPCTRGAVCCGYGVCNLGFGCLYDCEYCFLPGYVNTPGIILPANIDRFLKRFSASSLPAGPRPLRLGTGEFTDSLQLDDLTGYSLPLIEYFREREDVIFEFKTKSDNIANLLRIDPRGRIVVAWSLNPERLAAETEHQAASPERRLRAAAQVAAAGYRVAFHFDPILFSPNWEKEYGETIERMFAAVAPEQIAWISLGTLRFSPELKKVIESRFPGNTILDAEMILGYDGKLRYPGFIRNQIYRFMIDRIQARCPDIPLYLCMESREIWDSLRLPFPF